MACWSTSTCAGAAGHVPLDFAGLGVDLCSATPPTSWAARRRGRVLVRRGVRVPPFLVGGAQERGPPSRHRGRPRDHRVRRRRRRAGRRRAACPGSVHRPCPAPTGSSPRRSRRRASQLGDPTERVPTWCASPLRVWRPSRSSSASIGACVAVDSGRRAERGPRAVPVPAAMGVDAEKSLRPASGGAPPTTTCRLRAAFPWRWSGSTRALGVSLTARRSRLPPSWRCTGSPTWSTTTGRRPNTGRGAA